MPRALGHEISEMPHYLGANFLVHVIARFLQVFFQHRIQVPAPVLQFQKPGHVVDAGRQKINLLFGLAGVAGNEIHRSLHAVAEPHKLQTGHPPQSPAAHRHRVGIIEQQRLRAQLAHVVGNLQQRRNVPQSPENAARPQRVANALIHPVFQGYFVVLPELFHAAALDHHHHVIRSL